MTEEMMISPARPKRSARRARLAAAVLICGAALIVGCSSTTTTTVPKPATSPATHSPSPPSPAPTGTPSDLAAACVHINSLRTSLTSLTTIHLNPSAAPQLTHDLTNIGTQLTALHGMDLGAFSATANQLTAAVDKIKKDAAALATNPTEAFKSLTADITALRAKAQPMIHEMKTVCHA